MTRTLCRYNDQIHHHPYRLIVTERGPLGRVDSAAGSHPCLLPRTIQRFHETHTYPPHHIQPSDSSSTLHKDGPYTPPRLVYPPYSPLSAASSSSDSAPANYGNLDFSQSMEIHIPWNPDFPLSNQLPNATHGFPQLALVHSTPDPIPDPIFSRFHPPTENTQVSPVKELPSVPNNYHPTAPWAGPSPHYNLDHALDFYSGTSLSLYPCLWTQGGVICNAMVQATRSQMNRHLHAFHGFAGSETRQTRCCWAGCGETMQQGSIARHMVTCHLQAKVICPMCSKKLSRKDVVSKHQRICPAASALR